MLFKFPEHRLSHLCNVKRQYCLMGRSCLDTTYDMHTTVVQRFTSETVVENVLREEHFLLQAQLQILP